jgi:lipoyl(octanoyl) transferase
MGDGTEYGTRMNHPLQPPDQLDFASGSPPADWLEIRRLGPIDYQSGLALQRELHARVLEARAEGTRRGFVLLLEHDPPVVTVSRRPGATENVLASPEALAAHGVQRHETDRGGDVTYHGPGQLVVYSMVDLNDLGVRIHGWIRLLEQVLIEAIGMCGLVAGRDPGATGVWVGRQEEDQDGEGGRKIGAIGVRVSRWATMHGLALNVDPDLSHFDLIVPCGLAGRPVTSIAQECREAGVPSPTFDSVREVVANRLIARLEDPSDFRDRAASAVEG